ncbi:MAG: Na+/H+ antiporter NhaC family protein [Lachnospiraceae bacterium]|nr:Na+/H+ antiporter NhaC family protein [Lachnospiraceae bacterium]
MKKKGIIFLLASLVILGIFVALSMNTPGTVDPENYQPAVFSTFGALLPPIIAIALALITKEVYSSLFVGIVTGALLYANGNLELMLNTMMFNEDGGMIYKLADSWNVGILVFLVILGIMVALMNKVGGSAAFGKWASTHIKTRVGAQLATVVLGILIFVDDYFNCLTVGSVMRPVTDRHNISRAKLAYLIDATAAPICIIAPVSSWAAAVTSSVPEGSDINGFTMFLQTIPYNFYALCTILMMVLMIIFKTEFGPMRRHELNALKGDLFTTEARPYGDVSEEIGSPNGKVIDLVFPVLVLIACCILGMVYTGGFFSGESFIDAFAGADASVGLVIGSVITLIITFVFYMSRGVMTFKEFTECIPEGFKAMVAPILILTMAWTLSGMTGLLGAKFYVHDIVAASAGALQMFLPAVVFVVAFFLAFATGTSWGTFAILIPIVCNVFGAEAYQMLVISIAACLSGAVCGDHCSPISDTTIMASAGAHSDHVNHVSTQIPYVIVAAVVSFIGYLVSGIIGYTTGSSMALIGLGVSLVLMVIVVLAMRSKNKLEQ